jgi:probable O-glycosylation ligase (exosortase A-associated)
MEMFRPAVFRQYAPEPYRVHDAHSVYFEVMGEHGFIGFGMFMAIMAVAWMRGNSIIRCAKKVPELKWAQDLAGMLQVSIVGYASGGLFLGLSKFDFYWHLVAMLVILDYLVKQQIANPVTQNPATAGKKALSTNNPRARSGMASV